jgi:hypothetical protein
MYNNNNNINNSKEISLSLENLACVDVEQVLHVKADSLVDMFNAIFNEVEDFVEIEKDELFDGDPYFQIEIGGIEGDADVRRDAFINFAKEDLAERDFSNMLYLLTSEMACRGLLPYGNYQVDNL